MSEETYSIVLRGCIVAVVVLRLVYEIKRMPNYDTKSIFIRSNPKYASWETLSVVCFIVGLFMVPLNWGRFRYAVGGLPFVDSIRITGIVLCFMALGLFWMTHHQLGNNFSSTIESRQGHELIRDGVYAHIRHPMYASFYLLAVGVFLLSANWIVGSAAIGGTYALYGSRVPREEKFLLGEFGEQHSAYVSTTGRLVPGSVRVMMRKLKNTNRAE